MKTFHKFISIILCLTLILAFSTSFAFGVDWSTTDQSNLASIKSYLYSGSYSAAGWLSRIYSYIDNYMPTYGGQTLTNNNLSSIVSQLGFSGSTVDLKGALSIMNDHLSNIDSALTGSSGSGLAAILENIFNEMVGSTAGGAVIHYFQQIHSFTQAINSRVITIVSHLSDILTGITGIKTDTANIYSAQSTFNDFWLNNSGRSYNGWVSFNGDNISSLYTGTIAQTAYQNALMTGLFYINNNTTRGLSMLINRGLTGYNSSQNFVNWGSLGTSTFTPSSAVDGIYKYLNTIQAPVARLAYVLANDQEIAARNAAAANQTAVVDNFIDPSGSGSLPTSSIGSVSDMSDSFKDNFSTDASPTGLFDIFNSDHGSWFSQETADQLDTTNINARSLKAAPSDGFDTPLLDQQIDEIYNALGVKK